MSRFFTNEMEQNGAARVRLTDENGSNREKGPLGGREEDGKVDRKMWDVSSSVDKRRRRQRLNEGVACSSLPSLLLLAHPDPPSPACSSLPSLLLLAQRALLPRCQLPTAPFVAPSPATA